MPATSLRHKVVPLLVASILAIPCILSAEPRREVRPRIEAAAPAPLAFLGRLWSSLTSLWAEEGCHLDPNGRCVPNQGSGLTVPADSGCSLDPDSCTAVRAVTPAG